jgi:hypothetical protein
MANKRERNSLLVGAEAAKVKLRHEVTGPNEGTYPGWMCFPPPRRPSRPLAQSPKWPESICSPPRGNQENYGCNDQKRSRDLDSCANLFGFDFRRSKLPWVVGNELIGILDVLHQFGECFTLANDAGNLLQSTDVPAIVRPIFKSKVPQHDSSLIRNRHHFNATPPQVN